MQPHEEILESDPRFPSGKWTGYFIQNIPRLGKQWMELECVFQSGLIQATGRDKVGKFIFKGTYHLNTGKCFWAKEYIGGHPVSYSGFNEGQGIWGTWRIESSVFGVTLLGGFHIWPKGQGMNPEDSLFEDLDFVVERGHEMVPGRGLLFFDGDSQGVAGVTPFHSEIQGNICKHAKRDSLARLGFGCCLENDLSLGFLLGQCGFSS